VTKRELSPIPVTEHSALLLQPHFGPIELIQLLIANPTKQIDLVLVQSTEGDRSVHLRNQEVYAQLRDFVEDRV